MKNPFSLYAGLPRGVYILFVARIINRMGSFVHMFLTLFLTTRMGVPEKEAGLYLTLMGFSRVVGVLSGGKLADLWGRKRVMVGAQFLCSLFVIPCGFLGQSMLVPWLLIISGLFNGAVRPASGSMIADLVQGQERKNAYSLMYLGTNFGVAVGPLIAGFLFKNHTNFIFWGDGFTTLISALMILFFITESKPSAEEEKSSLKRGPVMERMEQGSSLRALSARPVLLIFSLLAFLANAVYAQNSFLIPLHLEVLFPGESARRFGYLMSFNAVSVLVMTSVLLRLTRKRSAIRNIALTCACYTLGFGLLGFSRVFPAFVLSVFIWTMGEILMVTNFSVYLANHSPINHRGRFNSFMNTVTAMGYVAGPFVTGMICHRYGVIRTWPYVAAAAAVIGGGLLLLDKADQSRQSLEQPLET